VNVISSAVNVGKAIIGRAHFIPIDAVECDEQLTDRIEPGRSDGRELVEGKPQDPTP
jgi:hypothetical protein